MKKIKSGLKLWLANYIGGHVNVFQVANAISINFKLSKFVFWLAQTTMTFPINSRVHLSVEAHQTERAKASVGE